MASMLENTPLELAVAAYLLRAYGFSNKTVYELLGDNGFDVSIYAPAAGSTGGTGDKNLNKQLFIPKTRDRVGGARGSPSWLPAGERMADWLAQQIGFANEMAMEDYTVSQVGSLNFSPAVTMGGFASGSAQRNLTKSHWDWTGTNSGAAVGGDTGSTSPHNMGNALNDVRSTNAFNLAGLTGNTPTTPPSMPPPPPTPTPPPTPPTPPVVPTPDPVVEDEIEIDMTDPAIAMPLPGEDPLDATIDAIISKPKPAPPVGRKLNIVPDMAPNGTTRGPNWLKSIAIDSLPKPSQSTRTLNEGTWEARENGTGGTAFPNMPTTDSQVFYPAVGPIYIVLDSWFPGKDFGPADDMTIRSMTSPGVGEDSYYQSGSPSPHRQMVIGLENGRQPAYYLVDGGNSSGSLSLTGWPGADKLQNTLSGDDRSQGVGDGSTKVAGLQIDWSNPKEGRSVPRRIRFILAKSGSKGGKASTLKFELARGDGQEYRLTPITSTDSRPNPLFATTTTELFGEIEEKLDVVPALNAGSIQNERAEVIQMIEFDDNLENEFRTITRMIPSDLNPNLPPGKAAVIVQNYGLTPVDQDIIVYGIPSSGVSGPGIFNISDTGAISPSSTSTNLGLASPLPRSEILGRTMVFPNKVRVFTSLDQYIGTNDESEILAREELEWDTSPDVGIIWDANDPTLSNNILSMQLEFQDANDTVTEYSGIVPNEPKAPRVQRIYLPGDIPTVLTPIGIPLGTTLMRVMGYPNNGQLAMQRIRAEFLTPDGTLQYREFPDASNRMALQYTTPIGTSPVQGKVVMQDADDGSSGYVLMQSLPADFNGSADLFTQQIIKKRRMTRASDLNLVLPTGSAPGVRQVVWRDGGSINILVPNPNKPSEMVWLNMILEDSLE